VPYSADDQYVYTPDEVEVLLLSGASQHLDHLDRLSDVERAFRWLRLEYPTGYQLVRAIIMGWTHQELAVKCKATPERIDHELVLCYQRMAVWLNAEHKRHS